MVENLGVPSFPDVPEDENHNIILTAPGSKEGRVTSRGVPRWTHAPRSQAETRLLGPEGTQRRCARLFLGCLRSTHILIHHGSLYSCGKVVHEY